MKTKEILDFLLPIFEEEPEQLAVELENQFPDLEIGEISRYYYRGYKELIKAIASIKNQDLFL